MAAVRERLTRGLVITADAIQEAFDDAVKRGRLTRDDAQDVSNDLMARGRKQAEDFLSDIESFWTRGFEAWQAAATAAGRQAAETMRRAAGASSSAARSAADTASSATTSAAGKASSATGGLPIANYDDLQVREINKRLSGLDDSQLREVRDHERKNRKRKTILDAIDRKLK